MCQSHQQFNINLGDSSEFMDYGSVALRMERGTSLEIDGCPETLLSNVLACLS